MSYIGVPPFGQTVRTVTERIATQDQTVFYPDGGYIPGYIDIEYNGSDLGSQDFTAADGLSVTLTKKAEAGGLFRSKAYWPVGLVNAVLKTGDSLIGALNEAADVTLASAATVAIGAAASNGVTVTGTTTITAFDSIPAGAVRRVTFTGALALTHNATSLILPGAASITTAAGDVAEFVSLGSGNWRCFNYSKAAGASSAYVGGRGQVFTSTGTFTIPDGVTALKVTVVGGGGGGYRNSVDGCGYYSLAGGGGGGGGAAVKYLTGLTSGNTLSVSALGAAGAVNGGSGGTSTVSSGTQSISSISATGGGGGGNQVGGTGGSGSGGDLNFSGSNGFVRNGGDSIFGGGAVNVSYAGTPGRTYGAAGSGSVGASGLLNGGTGYQGVVIFEW